MEQSGRASLSSSSIPSSFYDELASKTSTQRFDIPAWFSSSLPTSSFASLRQEILSKPLSTSLRSRQGEAQILSSQPKITENKTEVKENTQQQKVGGSLYMNEGNSNETEASFESLSDLTASALTNQFSLSKEWNSRFQLILDLILGFGANSSFESRIGANVELIKLFQDFVLSAKTYGKIIISEVCLPLEEKTIKPVLLGGQAGGSKYIVHNILFKLAVGSTELLNGNDYIAAKIAGHDLKGLTCWYNSQLKSVRYPMMIILDYRGYRLLCQSILPISKDTLIYGSANAGETIAVDPQIEVFMKKGAKGMNLKEHKVSSATISTAADIEGHKGTDGRYYMCDLSRTMPPEAPDSKSVLGHLYRLFRIEFLLTYKKALCSDAFSGFLADDPNKSEHNNEIVEATKYLLEELVPSVAKSLDEKLKGKDLANFPLTSFLHTRGVNMRHLDKVRKYVTSDAGKKILLIEMMARTIKNILRSNMRLMTRKLKILLEEPYSNLIIEVLNLVFGSTEVSTQYWKGDLKKLLIMQFPAALNEQESNESFNLKGILGDADLYLLFTRIQEMIGIKFSHSAELLLANYSTSKFFSNPRPLQSIDVIEVGDRSKYLNVVSHAQGYMYKMLARDLFGKENELHFYTMAYEKFKESVKGNPTNAPTLRNLAQVATSLAILEEFSRSRLEEAHELYLRAIQYSPDTHSYYQYATFLLAFTDQNEEIERALLLSLRVEPSHFDALNYYDLLLKDMGRTEEAKVWENRWKAFQINTFCPHCGRHGHVELHCDKLYKLFWRGKLVKH